MSTNKIQPNSDLQLRWAILCKNATVDQQSNNVSLFNVIEEFTVSKSPLGASVVKKPSSFNVKTAISGELTLVIQIEKKPEIKIQDFEPTLEIKMLDPNGDSLATTELSPVFQEGKNRLRVIIALNAIFVKEPGNYNFAISVRSSKKDTFREQIRVPLEVKIFE